MSDTALDEAKNQAEIRIRDCIAVVDKKEYLAKELEIAEEDRT